MQQGSQSMELKTASDWLLPFLQLSLLEAVKQLMLLHQQCLGCGPGGDF